MKTIREFFKKDYDASDIRTGIVAAVSVRVVEPVFESQTKTKLGSLNVDVNGPSMRQFFMDFLGKELDNFLHKNPTVGDALKKRIEQSERERKEMAGIKKLANERAKKPTFTTVNSGTAGTTSTMILLPKAGRNFWPNKKKRPFSLPKVIVRVVPSPRPAVWKRRRSLVCAESHSTALD